MIYEVCACKASFNVNRSDTVPGHADEKTALADWRAHHATVCPFRSEVIQLEPTGQAVIE